MNQDKFESNIVNFIRKEGLLCPGDKVLAAVSGGADSVCLLLILKKLESILKITVEAVTVNHGIRGVSAEQDVEFVEKICTEHEIPLHICRVDVPELVRKEQLSEEEAARKARYECFEKIAETCGAAAVAVAHHGDDNCETVLHHLFRGSSLKGLGGMAPRRRLSQDKDIYIIRPLLEVRRRDIEAWMETQKIPWCTDETNLEDDYTRNRMRHHVIPLVEQEINTRAAEHVIRAARDIAQAQELVEELAEEWLERYGSLTYRNVEIPIRELKACRPIVRREILLQSCKAAAKTENLKDVGHIHLEMLESLAEGETSRRMVLPGGICVRKEYDRLIFEQEVPVCTEQSGINGELAGQVSRQMVLSVEKASEETSDSKNSEKKSGSHIIEIENSELASGIGFRIFSYQGEKIPENNYTKWFDYDTIKAGLSLRTRRTGDYFLLDGGGRKTVKSYMIDRKIPAEKRDSMLLLAEGSHVLWLQDGRISAAYKVHRDTHHVLEIYVKRGE